MAKQQKWEILDKPMRDQSVRVTAEPDIYVLQTWRELMKLSVEPLSFLSRFSVSSFTKLLAFSVSTKRGKVHMVPVVSQLEVEPSRLTGVRTAKLSASFSIRWIKRVLPG